jgi:rubredoxin
MSATKKWRCTVCGQVFEGDQPPVPCPVCGAGASAFALEEQVGLSKWRCAVCNQVFDGENPPTSCPICGAGVSAFEKIYEASGEYKKDTDEAFVIVGGGIAALETAKAIRRRNSTASITMILGEGILPYNRPALSDVLADSLSFDSILLEQKTW